MTKTTRIVCLCILGAVGMLCGVSTINAPVTEDKIEMITPTEPLRSAYIVADIAMQDPVAISVQGELYALERRVLAEYNGDNTTTSHGYLFRYPHYDREKSKDERAKRVSY